MSAPERPEHPIREAAPTAPFDRASLEQRLQRAEDRLERLVGELERLEGEVRTRRLVVTDAGGAERMVAETRGTTMELRLFGPGDEDRPEAVLYVTEARVGRNGSRKRDQPDLGAAAGLQLWAEGEAVVEVDAWPDRSGRWQPHLHAGGG